jgi:hypothetical protein
VPVAAPFQVLVGEPWMSPSSDHAAAYVRLLEAGWEHVGQDGEQTGRARRGHGGRVKDGCRRQPTTACERLMTNGVRARTKSNQFGKFGDEHFHSRGTKLSLGR